MPNFTYIFVIKMVSAMPLGILQAMFSMVAMDYFHLEPKGNGLVLSYVGIMGMVGFVLSYLFLCCCFLWRTKFMNELRRVENINMLLFV